jgi:signal transduction histidine kinase
MLQAIALRCVCAVGRLAAQEDIRERSLLILKAEEMERRRISRELHDEPAQLLAVVRLQLEMIESGLPESLRADVLETREQVDKIIFDVRRLISDLSPVILQQLGLEAAIRQLVTRFKRSGDAEVAIHLGTLPRVSHQFALVVYRSLQECFANISRHSLANRINVSITTADRVLRLQVEDDGIGFHVKEALSREDCFGLVGMRERITLLGGRLSILSTPQCGDRKRRRSRSGTEICIELPLPEKIPR